MIFLQIHIGEKCITFRNLFLKQLSLPAELVDFTFCREKLLKGVADEITVLGHLSRLVEEIKSLKVSSSIRF